jgi:hypothetical protein
MRKIIVFLVRTFEPSEKLKYVYENVDYLDARNLQPSKTCEELL